MMTRHFRLSLICIAFAVAVTCVQGICPAQTVNGKYYFTAVLIKSALKTYILTKDFDEIKTKMAEAINSVSDEDISREMSSAADIIALIPQKYRIKYGISMGMEKKELLGVVSGLDKDDLTEAIDAIPEKCVAEILEKYSGSFPEDSFLNMAMPKGK